MKIVDVVAGLAYDYEKGAMLLARRHPSDVGEWSEKWCLPGGKVEVDETLAQALTREWWEELDGELLVGRLLSVHIYHTEGYPHPYRVHVFEVLPITEPKITPEGGTELAWVPVQDIDPDNVLPSTLRGLESLQALLGAS